MEHTWECLPVFWVLALVCIFGAMRLGLGIGYRRGLTERLHDEGHSQPGARHDARDAVCKEKASR